MLGRGLCSRLSRCELGVDSFSVSWVCLVVWTVFWGELCGRLSRCELGVGSFSVSWVCLVAWTVFWGELGVVL